MEQELKTIREIVKRYYEDNIDESNIPREHYEWEIQDLMIGFAYQWQQERMYSEEDLKYAFDSGRVRLTFDKERPFVFKNYEEFIEQFKNK